MAGGGHSPAARWPRKGSGHAHARPARRRGLRGDDRHRRRGLHRHAGPPDGQAHPGRVLPRRGLRARGGGLQLPAGARHGDGPGSGLRDGELGEGVRRLRHRPRPRDASPHPVARLHRLRALRRGLARRHPGRSVAAPGPHRPVRARPRARLHADDELRARVLPLQGQLRRGVGEGLQRPAPDDPLHPRLPRAGHDDGRALHPPAAPRHAGRRHPRRVLQGRSVVRPARAQRALRGRRHRGRPAHDLQERRQGDRPPQRALGDFHGQDLREGHRQLVPHPHEPRGSGGRSQRLRRRRARRPTSSATSSAACATASASSPCSSRPA